jgi:hypothetical protein
MKRWAFIAVLAGCGHGAGTAPAPVRHEPPPSITATPDGADDPVVARVDGRPVYGSCVRAQAQGMHVDAKQALDQCIAFEVLAGEADKRGLREDADVGDAWRKELVRAIIRKELGAIHSLDDLPPAMVEKYRTGTAKILDRPALRTAQWVRVEVPETAPRGGPEDLAAKAVADKIYAELGPQGGLQPEDLQAAGDRAAAGTGIEVSVSAKPYTTPEDPVEGMIVGVPEFRAALYSIPELGHVAAPTRTQWGWDVILWWDDHPPEDRTQSFFEFLRPKYFDFWVSRLAKLSGVPVKIDEDLLQQIAGAE